jgi:hypothetical protein
MKRTRLFLSLSWFLGAAIVCGSPLAGCDSSRTSDGPLENIPKESPVLGPGKASAEAFFANKKGAAKTPKAPSK